MDVNEAEVTRVLEEANINTIIHGHTHRPFIHEYNDNKKRIVLGDWDQKGWEIVINEDSNLNTVSLFVTNHRRFQV